MIKEYNSTVEYIIDINYQNFADINQRNANFSKICKIIAVCIWSILTVTGLIGFLFEFFLLTRAIY